MRIVEQRTEDARNIPEADRGLPEIQQLPLPAFNPSLMFHQHALHHFAPNGEAFDQARQWRWELPIQSAEIAGPSHTRNDSKVDEQFDLPGPRISKVDLIPLANLFATRLSVLWPVLPESIQREAACINVMRLTRSVYSFLCAVAAYTMTILRSQHNFFAGRCQADSELHAQNSVRDFERLDTGGVADRYSIRTALLLSLYYWEWEKPKLAWMCLHEAISLMQVSGYDKESAYAELNEVDAQEWKRLYWTLFMAERIQARRRGVPFRLQKSMSNPETTGQFAYLGGFCVAAETMSMLRRSTTKLSTMAGDMGWLMQGIQIVTQARQQLPMLPFVQRIMVWLTCLTVELQLWQCARVTPELGSVKLAGRLSEDVPVVLLGEICQTLCSLDPPYFEVFGANLFLETIEVAMCVVDQLSLDLPMDLRSNKLFLLQQFSTWLERAENKPQAAYERFKEKLRAISPSIIAPESALTVAGHSATSAKHATPLSNMVGQVWSDRLVQQHDELVEPLALPQELPADCILSPQACRPRDAEQDSSNMP